MKFIIQLLLSCCLSLIGAASAFGAAEHVPAFVNVLKEGKYEDANFYVSQGYITVEDIDPSRVLFQVIDQKYRWQILDNMPAIEQLISYLRNFGTFDLNAPITCEVYGRTNICGVSDRLISTGQPMHVIEYFVEMGLDLNTRAVGDVPIELKVITRLGTEYSLENLNRLTALGLKIGAQRFSISDVLAVSHSTFEASQRLFTMPGNYASIREFNFLDVLILTVGSLSESQSSNGSATSGGAALASKTDFLCGFALHAAPSYTPSFDYLIYLLRNRSDFRARHIGTSLIRDRIPYMPFPDSCVTLIRAMAGNHARIQDVISAFAADGDIATAEWLIATVNQASGTAPAQTLPAAPAQ